MVVNASGQRVAPGVGLRVSKARFSRRETVPNAIHTKNCQVVRAGPSHPQRIQPRWPEDWQLGQRFGVHKEAVTPAACFRTIQDHRHFPLESAISNHVQSARYIPRFVTLVDPFVDFGRKRLNRRRITERPRVTRPHGLPFLLVEQALLLCRAREKAVERSPVIFDFDLRTSTEIGWLGAAAKAEHHDRRCEQAQDWALPAAGVPIPNRLSQPVISFLQHSRPRCHHDMDPTVLSPLPMLPWKSHPCPRKVDVVSLQVDQEYVVQTIGRNYRGNHSGRANRLPVIQTHVEPLLPLLRHHENMA